MNYSSVSSLTGFVSHLSHPYPPILISHLCTGTSLVCMCHTLPCCLTLGFLCEMEAEILQTQSIYSDN